MIIGYKSPVRISLFGGSGDYQSFWSKNSAEIIGFAINKYYYIFSNPVDSIKPQHSTLNYSVKETVDNNTDVKNNGLYGIFKYLDFKDYIDLNVMTDIVSQCGLGSSSAFICATLSNLAERHNIFYSKHELALASNHIERVILGEPGGNPSQDNFFASYGGFNRLIYSTNGQVDVEPLNLSDNFIQELENHSIVFYLGKERQSFTVAESHDNNNAEKVKIRMQDICKSAYSEFKAENLGNIGKLLTDSWEEKKRISSLVSNGEIDEYIDIIRQNGGYGYKLNGSGSGGCITVLCEPKNQQQLINNVGLKYTKFKIDWGGTTKII